MKYEQDIFGISYIQIKQTYFYWDWHLVLNNIKESNEWIYRDLKWVGQIFFRIHGKVNDMISEK